MADLKVETDITTTSISASPIDLKLLYYKKKCDMITVITT